MSRLLTDAEIAELRLEHNDGGGIGVCMACHAAWPCWTILALDELEQCRLLILDALEATEGALATLRDLVRRIGPQIIAWGDLVGECLWCHARAEDTLMSVEHEPDCPWVVIDGMLEIGGSSRQAIVYPIWSGSSLTACWKNDLD